MNSFLRILLCTSVALNCFAQNFVSTSPSNKNVLLEGFGGINCYYCAEGDATATSIQNLHPDRIVWINIHAGIFAEPSANEPDLRSSYADTLLTVSGLTTFPAAMINRREFPDFAQNQDKLAIETTNWSNAADTILAESSPVNIAARSEFNISTRILKVVVETYYTANSINNQNRLFAALLLDSLRAAQEGATVYNPTAIGSDGKYIHKNILFDYINSATYITNTNSGSFRADTFYYNVPADFNGSDFDLTSPKVAVWVTENDSAQVLNAAYSQMTIVSDFNNSAALVSADWDADFNLLCGTESAAEVKIVNLGNAAIDSITVDYTINAGTAQRISANLTTPLSIGKTQRIQLPAIGGLNSFSNSISLKITSVNNVTNADTGEVVSVLNQAQVMVSDSTNGVLTVRFDNHPNDISWSLVDETDGITILSDSNYIITNSLITQNFTAINGHCYAFVMKDSFGDGLCCGSGQGYYELKIGNLRIIRESEFAFETGTKFNFEEGVIAVNPTENSAFDAIVYPNPTRDFADISIEASYYSDISLQVQNLYGQLIEQKNTVITEGMNNFRLETTNYPSGIYLISIKVGNQKTVLKLSVTK